MAAAQTPVRIVTGAGTPRALTAESPRGSKPSRDMAKNTRLWPNMKAMITVGSAMTAAAAISTATNG